MKPIQDSSVRWREEADRARAIAEKMTDPEPRRIMGEIAKGYELLASHAMRWTIRKDDEGSVGERPVGPS